MMTRIKTEAEIAAMRTGGHMLAKVLEVMRQKAKPGLTPKDMSAMAAAELQKLGGEPAFLGVPGFREPFPDIICISVNDQVQHAIPGDRPFQTGDVVNFDFGVLYEGLITDAGMTVGIGQVSPRNQELIEGTRAALEAAIAVVKDGVQVGDISATIEAVLRRYRLGIVRDLVGHGVGHELHEGPEIPNYGRAGQGAVLRAGMTIAIEPITTTGSFAIYQDSDGWTLRSQDGSYSAQFEHTVLVTKNGSEVLTRL